MILPFNNNIKNCLWNEKIKHPNGIEYRNWVDGEDYFYRYTINNPNGIISDLEQCKRDLGWKKRIDNALEFIKGSQKYLDEKIHGIIVYHVPLCLFYDNIIS